MSRLTNIRNNAFKIARTIGYSAYFACVVHCVWEYIGDFVVCLGPSMEPTIYSENVVVTEHISVSQHKVNRGDIVISKSPFNPKQFICKRVKAIAGDKVHIGLFSEIVPKGHVWLEGDNKDNSSDSRNYGPVPQGLIRGKLSWNLNGGQITEFWYMFNDIIVLSEQTTSLNLKSDGFSEIMKG